MNECPSEDELVRMVEGALAVESLAIVESHVAGCSQCASIIGALGAIAHPGAARPGGGPTREVGRYQLDRRIAAGGMGEVWAGWDPQLRRDIAVKLVRPDRADDGRERARLLREAQALARLTHPNVLAVYDVGEVDGEVFLATELVAGDTLANRGGPGADWRALARLYIQAARGLAAAHAAGMVHRDVKPSNLLLGADGRVRVADFGLAVRAGARTPSADALGSPSPRAAVGSPSPGAPVGSPSPRAAVGSPSPGAAVGSPSPDAAGAAPNRAGLDGAATNRAGLDGAAPNRAGLDGAATNRTGLGAAATLAAPALGSAPPLPTRADQLSTESVALGSAAPPTPDRGATFSPAVTATGAIAGTPAYMAPEQRAGTPADARADQFAFCVSLGESIIGRRPAAGMTRAELSALFAERRALEPDLDALCAILARGLARSAHQRFDSMTSLADALAALVDPAELRASAAVAAAAVPLSGPIALPASGGSGAPGSGGSGPAPDSGRRGSGDFAAPGSGGSGPAPDSGRRGSGDYAPDSGRRGSGGFDPLRADSARPGAGSAGGFDPLRADSARDAGRGSGSNRNRSDSAPPADAESDRGAPHRSRPNSAPPLRADSADADSDRGSAPHRKRSDSAAPGEKPMRQAYGWARDGRARFISDPREPGSDPRDARTPDLRGGRSRDDRSARPDARDGDARDGDARSADARSADGRSADGRSTDARGADGRGADGRSADGRSADGRSADARSIDGRSADGRASRRDPRASASRRDPRASASRSGSHRRRTASLVAVCIVSALAAGGIAWRFTHPPRPAAAEGSSLAPPVTPVAPSVTPIAPTTNPGGTSANPGATTNPAATMNPGGAATNPGGATTNPGGAAANPGPTTNPAATMNPRGAAANPGGAAANPGGAATNPGGATTNPGGATSTNPGAPSTNPAATTSPGAASTNPAVGGGTPPAAVPGHGTSSAGGATEGRPGIAKAPKGDATKSDAKSDATTRAKATQVAENDDDDGGETSGPDHTPADPATAVGTEPSTVGGAPKKLTAASFSPMERAISRRDAKACLAEWTRLGAPPSSIRARYGHATCLMLAGKCDEGTKEYGATMIADGSPDTAAPKIADMYCPPGTDEDTALRRLSTQMEMFIHFDCATYLGQSRIAAEHAVSDDQKRLAAWVLTNVAKCYSARADCDMANKVLGEAQVFNAKIRNDELTMDCRL
ncbi:MAG TPA: protein kinase [Kofleriaceae bacterium]